jgi:hypothetical protein
VTDNVVEVLRATIAGMPRSHRRALAEQIFAAVYTAIHDLSGQRDVKWNAPGTTVAGALHFFRDPHRREEVDRTSAGLIGDDGTMNVLPTGAKGLQPLFDLAEGTRVAVTYVGLGERQSKIFAIENQ